MDVERLAEVVSEIDAVAPHLEYLNKIAKPRVDIALVDDEPTAECSRFGGDPFVPIDFEWPQRDIGEYRFLGQINFAEIQDAPSILPRSGLLSLFYAYNEDGECFWRDDGYVLGYFWEDLSDHAYVSSPSDDAPAPQRIKLASGIDLPRHEELRKDWPFNRKTLRQLADTIDADGEYLLGYPSFNTLGYDPTPGPDWISLLTVGSLDEFEWCWHDGDTLMVFIESAKLALKDFSNLKSDAG
jgi:uncharacterized protein YwqG